MLNKINIIIFSFICFLFLSSCQQTEYLDDVVFDNSLLNKISIIAEEKEIKASYKVKLNGPFIDHVMRESPTMRGMSWLESNINIFGNENKLVIDIQNASIIRKEIDSEIIVAGIVKKKI